MKNKLLIAPFVFESKAKPLLPVKKFYKRLLSNFLFASTILFISLLVGVAGYITLAHLPLADAVLNASMILSGMGPVDTMPTDAAKYFASFYALFSGVTFIGTVAILISPIVHRFMHKFHLETDEEEEKEEKGRKK